MRSDKWISEPLRHVEAVSRPAFELPPLSCDAHMHVFGPSEIYRSIPNPKYTKPEGSLSEYLALADRLNIGRIVFVQASFYGTDNSCILDAMAQVGSRCRGVAFLPEAPPAALIDDLHGRGVRGLRLDLFRADAERFDRNRILEMIARGRRVAKQAGWHLEFYSPGRWIRDLIPVLSELDLDFSVNHMGYMTKEEGLTDDDFRAFVTLAAASDHCWVKLTGTYRVSKDDDTDRTDWMARELVAAAPDRVIWGTDWPHIPKGGRDTGEFLNRLQFWCPDDAARKKILVNNPARLYQFDLDPGKRMADDVEP